MQQLLTTANKCMGLCSSAATTTPDTTAIDLSAFKLNYLNMPILLIKQQKITNGPSKYQIDVDGPLPQDVIELGFVKVDDKYNTGLQATATQIPSMAGLLSTLIDQHGWKLEQTVGTDKLYYQLFVLSKPPE